MTRCPNCFRETLRTKDWACYLCGYPLASPGFKLVDKTYSQIRAERLYGQKTDVQEDQQIYDNNETENDISQEMQNVPLVTNNIDEIDSAYEDTSVTTDELPDKPAPEQNIIEQEVLTDTEAVNEDEMKIESGVYDYKEVTEEIETFECTIETVKTVNEVTENIETVNEELVTNIDTTEEEPCVEAVEEETEPAATEEPAVDETQPIYVDESACEEREHLAPADIDITMEQLLAEYAADYKEATNKYVNKILRLSGYAAAIDVKEVLAINYIRLTDASLNLTKSVQCMFDKKYADVLKSIEKEQQVTIQGKYTGSLIAMRMTDCVLI